MIKIRKRLLALPLIAVLTLGPTPAPTAAPRANWNNTVTLTPGGGHLLGNPSARIKLTEYASYTCSHCAEFEVQASSALRVGYIASGRLAFEIRHLVRDPVDMTVALLANCGAPSRFFLNHGAYMRSQATWMRPLQNASPAMQARWTTGDMATRRRNIATDLHLYEIAATRGHDRQTAERCLADEAMAQRLAAQTQESQTIGIAGTPSFLINGALLLATHNWQALRPQLDARM